MAESIIVRARILRVDATGPGDVARTRGSANEGCPGVTRNSRTNLTNACGAGDADQCADTSVERVA